MSAEHLALYDSDFRAENRKVVFGKGREKNSNPELRFGLTPNPHGTSALIGFRRTDADRKPARVVIRSNDGPGDMAERYRLAEKHGLTLHQMGSLARRDKAFAARAKMARYEFWARCKAEIVICGAPASWQWIAALTGNNHSTVLAGARRFRNRSAA